MRGPSLLLGSTGSRRAVLLGLLIACAPTVSHAETAHEADVVVPTAPATVEALLSSFAQLQGLEATFREEKEMALLAAPLVSEGRLQFAQPGLLRREITTPSPSLVIITEDALHFADASGSETIDLRARGDVRQFVESLVWILAGNTAQLRETYTLAYDTAPATAGHWTLTLTPQGRPLSEIVGRIVVRGVGPGVAAIVVEETNGDVTTTTILTADPTRVFTEAERAELFEPPSP